ncbi:MAG TPA: hypothetical protein VFF69_09040 [Phycisphaerales bacterium]|nr:hypothetical protein [Phycisphaerales bacterium]
MSKRGVMAIMAITTLVEMLIIGILMPAVGEARYVAAHLRVGSQVRLLVETGVIEVHPENVPTNAEDADSWLARRLHESYYPFLSGSHHRAVLGVLGAQMILTLVFAASVARIPSASPSEVHQRPSP